MTRPHDTAKELMKWFENFADELDAVSRTNVGSEVLRKAAALHNAGYEEGYGDWNEDIDHADAVSAATDNTAAI